MDGMNQTSGNANGPQQQLQPQQLQPQIGAEALNAAAVQQAIAAFQASVEQAASANNHHNPLFAAQQQVMMLNNNAMAFPAPTSTAAPAPAVAVAQNPILMANATQQNQQQLWQQAWLSALLPAPQAALTQPYLAAVLNPMQQLTQQPQLSQTQQIQLQQQQQTLLPQPPPALLPAKRKAPGFTSSLSTSETKQQQRKDRKQAATVVSNNDCTLEKPPIPKTEAELLLMTQSERRRYERNLREQQRSYKISQQIKCLRDVLEESNIPFRPNKYSILVNVADYIKQLQSRAIMLDSEHQRLIDTIKYTTEKSLSPSSTIVHNSQQPALESDAPLVQGIDYRNVFCNARFPLGVATLDGRVLACNRQMERLLQTSESIVDQSFFVFIRNHQEIFEAMADLLKRSTATIETGEGTITKSSRLLFWCGHILSSTNQTFPFAITLTNDANDNPKFFSLSAAIPPPPVT